MRLKTIYSSADEIPEQYRELYTERNGQFELTGIDGVKTQGDIDRLQTSLAKEREDHKETKAALSRFGSLDPDEVHAQLDRIPSLEAAASGKSTELDEAQRRQITAPLERDIAKITAERDEAISERDSLRAERRTDKIRAAVTDAAVKAKVVDTALDDVVLLGERVFDLAEDGSVLVRDNVGYTPGLDPSNWLLDMRERRSHWWPPSQGGGGNGSSGMDSGPNPWAKSQWNLTEQGKILVSDPAKAQRLAALAGSKIGAVSPSE